MNSRSIEQSVESDPQQVTAVYRQTAASLPAQPSPAPQASPSPQTARSAPESDIGGDLAQAVRNLQHSVDELRQAQAALREENHALLNANQQMARERLLYRDLFDLAPDAYLITDLHGNILEANQAAGAFFRVRSDLLIDRTVLDFVLPWERHNLAERLLLLGRSSPLREWELRVQPANAARVLHAWVRVAIVQDAGDRPITLRWMLRDITERKRQEEQLRSLNADLERRVAERTAQLESANRAKDRFLAVLSHELRTPLTPVMTAAAAMEHEPDLPPSLRSSVQMIRRNAELEARLIEDLLDLTRISNDKLQLERRTVDAHEVLQNAVDVCHDEIRDKQLRLTIHTPAPRHHVSADAARLQQIFWNLIKNAIKFTPAGGALVLSTSTTDDSRFQLQVIDSGIGFDSHVLGKLFNAFEQGDSSITRHFGGLGLGLAISNSLVQAHEGTLTAHSAGKGRGATFTVMLPVVDPPQDAGCAEAASPAEAGPAPDEPLDILLVEDHVDTATVMAQLLRKRGHRVRVSGGVQPALAAIAQHPCQLLICDIGLPDGSGLDLMRTVRSQFPSVAGVALTGFGTLADIQQSRAAGFAAHVTKPIDFAKLYAAIQQAPRQGSKM